MKAADWCRSSAGAALVLATSSDAEHPAESVADGSSKTFWTTTGMFPQELIIGFPKCVKISKVAIQCYLVRTLRIERSTSKDPVGFEQCIEKGLSEGHLVQIRTLKIISGAPKFGHLALLNFSASHIDLQHTEGQLQMEEFPLPEFQATYLRFIIKSAFDHFVSVHRVMAEGTAENT